MIRIAPSRLAELGVSAEDTQDLCVQIDDLLLKSESPDCWQQVSRSLLKAGHGFEVHRYVCEAIFAEWDPAKGPRPIWSPTPDIIERSNIQLMMKERGFADYARLHEWSIRQAEQFWKKSIERVGIHFENPPDCTLDISAGSESPDWLPGARLNIVTSCFRADAGVPAIVYDDEAGGISSMSYGQLQRLSRQVAYSLRRAGLRPGDAVGVDMPMTVESVAIYLGIVLMGGVVVSIADSFAAPEIATRLRIAGAKVVFTSHLINRGGRTLPLYQKVVEADPGGAVRVVVLDGKGKGQCKLRPGDQRWEDFLGSDTVFAAEFGGPDRAVNVLFSSGTTGEPKAIVWDQTTPIKCAIDGFYHHDIHPGSVVAWPTNLGWMMGPWLIFATLINRGTMALFSDAPLGRSFGEFIQDARVNMLGVIPSLVRHWRQTRCMEGLDWSAIRAFSSTGECSEPGDMFYLMYLGGYKPIIEYCGGTEIGGGYITSTVVQPNAPSTFSTPALGSELIILDDEGKPADVGELFLVPPAMGLSRRLLNRNHHEVYYQDVPSGPSSQVLRRHGDQMERLGGRYYRALGRADDTMNLAGVKVSSAEIERVLNRLDGVHETAAVAVPPQGGGPGELVIFVVREGDCALDAAQLRSQFQQAIKHGLNPLFRVDRVRIVDALPRTASNKVMRRELRAKEQNG